MGALPFESTLVGWGYAGFGQDLHPPGLTNVVAIAAANHNLALLADGTVRAWGNNIPRQIEVPEGLSNVVAIACRSLTSAAVKQDGTLVQWGLPTTIPPEIQGRILSLEIGSGHYLALLTDHTIWAWGSNTYGEASPPAGLSDVVYLGKITNPLMSSRCDNGFSKGTQPS